jgi:hypothetical protein
VLHLLQLKRLQQLLHLGKIHQEAQEELDLLYQYRQEVGEVEVLEEEHGA